MSLRGSAPIADAAETLRGSARGNGGVHPSHPVGQIRLLCHVRREGRVVGVAGVQRLPAFRLLSVRRLPVGRIRCAAPPPKPIAD
jgi:hypothetical protein